MDFHNYFIGLEDRFIEISKYVEVDTRNFETFSSEIALVYMAACSEFEVVSIEISKVLKCNFKVERIRPIFRFFNEYIPEILKEGIDIRPYRLDIYPFEGWTEAERPRWWVCYNDVKHDRTSNYKFANLGNLINAMCALQIVNYYLIWKRDCFGKSRYAPPIHMHMYPKVFTMSGVDYDAPTSSADYFDII